MIRSLLRNLLGPRLARRLLRRRQAAVGKRVPELQLFGDWAKFGPDLCIRNGTGDGPRWSVPANWVLAEAPGCAEAAD